MHRSIFCGLAALTLAAIAFSQQPPPPRTHTVIEKGTLRKVPTRQKPPAASQVSITVEGDERVIRSNGIPAHLVGRFPNRGNPNAISAQNHVYRIPANPKVVTEPTLMHGQFGVALNGVPFDPGAAEFYDGEPGWQYEPLSGAINLGIDMSHAHVQPTGKYHYHGLPTGLLEEVKLSPDNHSPLIGWAADGFPIYALYGYSDPEDASSAVAKLTSSYRLREGRRPGGNAPGGTYDGTFVADYEFVSGSGDLDECNGRFTVTPDFPDGTYAYYLTEDWPVIPRLHRGTPSRDFAHGRPGGRRERNGRGDARARREQPGGDIRPGRGRLDAPRASHHGGPPMPGEVLPEIFRNSLDLSAEQVQQLDALQRHVDGRLGEILTEDQLRKLKTPPGGDSRRPQHDGPPFGRR